MACTRQSAFVYIEKARSRLLGKLKNLSVILENLRQKEVFSDEAVSKIQAEKDDYDKTRRILDWVKCKGEDACYEFLRIVDMTRKRTLEVDLHHWISCFPFREDAQMDTNYLQGPKPCHRYQAKLKLKARKTSNEFWMANKYLFEENNKPDLSYMSLVLDTQGSVSPSKIKKLKSKKSKMIRPKKLRTYVPEDKVGTSPGDLLKTYLDVLVVGKPGIGKTALTQEMLKLWADRDNDKLDYMFYFDMRETSHITKAVSLEDLLFNMFSEPDEGKEEVLQDIKNNSDNVTLIFDGMTDLSSSVVKRLVEKDLLPDAKIIVTCRQDDEEEFSSEDFLRVEVKGFSEQTIKAYLAEMLGKEQKKVFSNVELLTLCHVPIYALMVAACFSFETPEDSPQPCTITEIYINIVRFCLQRNSNNLKTRDLNPFIKNKRKEILSLAEAAFNATEGKNVKLTELPCKDSCVLSFLKPLVIKTAPTETMTTYAFLHYTMQEFFAALWLLKNPDKIKDVFQQCLTEEKKHMKHLIPFMCRLLNEKSPSLMKYLIPAEELKNTSDWFFKEMITTFFTCLCEADTEDSRPDVDILFLCQCLYESQCPEACIHLLEKLDYHLDLSGESLDPLPCCAVAYVVTQSEERKVSLNLEDVRVSDQGMRRLFGCLKNVQWRDPLPLQLWKIFLLSEGQMDHLSLLGLDGNQLHLPVEGKRCLFEQAVKVMQKMSMKVNVCLHWDRETRVCQDLCESLFEALSYISSLRVTCRGPGLQDQKQHHGTLERKEKQLLLDLCQKAALHKGESCHNVVNTLLSLFSVNTGIHDILLDFYQHVKSGGFLSIIPLKPLFQSAPAVWVIDLSERKTSILLEVLKLQSEKKQVKLTGWSDEESEVRSFLQCLRYISQLSFYPWGRDSGAVKFCGNLFCAAAEREQQTGEKILKLLSSLCSYQRFPLSDRFDDDDDDDDDKKHQSDFLLDLYSHLKDYETQTGLSVLPSVQSVFQSAPAVWVIDLSKRKTSILLEVLKLQSEKKQVELTGWSDEESEVRSFLQCVPYISQLSCGPEFFQRVCTLISVRSREEAEHLASLLQLLGFTLLLTGELHLNTCRTVGRVLVLCGLDVNLILTPRKISVRGASVLFRRTTRLHSLRLSNDMALLLCRWVRGGRVVCPVTIEELSLSPQRAKPSERVLLKVVSNVASLLRYWTVRRLDLTEFCVPAQGVIPLLLHDGPLTVKLSEEIFQQLLFLLHEIQDKHLTQFFLSKVGGDLTSCCVNWELLHYLLQQSSSQTFTVNLRKNSFLQKSITRLLPFLDRIVFKRLSPSFVLTAIREIYEARASPIIPSLLRSFDHVINLCCREMDSVDCAALLFTLRHSVRVKLNLLWSSIPAGQTESILFTLDRVSQLSADRSLLLRLVHCCAASDVQQGAAVDLLRTVQHRLDLSCSSCVALDQSETLSLTAGDCRAVSAVLRHSSQDTQVILQDCEVEDSGLDLLFPVLNRVRLRASKAVLLQLVSLVPVNSERDTVRRAVSLCRALGGELDFSHSTLDQRACGALALMLDSCEELTELDLSHCRLTDQLLLTLSAHLHKVQVLDLSHNNVTDASTDTLLQLVSTNPSIHTVRLFGNKIVDRTCFDKHKFEIW
ncbi:uncharacterized protein LOC126403551 isoform X2 [Epinephelus moara]|uniref:uncharacterized protein LOC126403551 isoform X2 n=1 Tax=Epinephelus moara TaxID=300413 RepID=UPI00214E435C|nr:uncharacterized protein LOC126403551 isoform X2 [Epinephelus moara]